MPDKPEKKERILCPEGRFDAKVLSHDLSTSKNGTDLVAIAFQFKDLDDKSHVLTYYGYMSEKALENEFGVMAALKALNYDLDDMGFSDEAFAGLGAKSKDNPKGGALVGREASIVVSHETQTEGEYKGKKQDRIAFVNAPGGGLGIKADSRVEAGAIPDLAARVRARANAEGGPAPSTGAAKPVQNVTPKVTSGKPKSDLPF